MGEQQNPLTEVSRSPLSRRTFLSGSAALTGAVWLAACDAPGAAGGSAPKAANVQYRKGSSSGQVKIGMLEDQSGNFALFGKPKIHGAQLAIAEINDGYTLADSEGGFSVLGQSAAQPPTETIHAVVNEGGALSQRELIYREDDNVLVKSGDKGLLGRQVQLVAPDPQSDNRRFQELGRRLVQQDNVDVVMAGFASAEREAIRPIMDELHQLYWYNNQYEGGVADKYTFCTGAVPEQQIIPVMQYMVKTFGPKFYVLAADYNFGHLSTQWSQAYAPLLGATVSGVDFIPLSVSQFSDIISKVQQAKPDWLLMYITGENQSNYYPQANAAGVHIPMGSSVNMAQGYEHLRFKAPALAGMHVTTNWMHEYQTKRAQDFITRWLKMFPDEPYIAQESATSYLAVHLYAKAVRLAGSTDQEQVIRALESGLAMEAPEGPVFMDPATHHLTHSIRLARADEQQNISFVKTWQAIEPWWTRRLGVNLVSQPLYKQFTPKDDPYFQHPFKKQ